MTWSIDGTGLLREDERRFVRSKIRQVIHASGIQTSTTLAIVLVDDVEIKKLNNDFRAKNQSTDVLSFPAHDVDEEIPAAFDVFDEDVLGDIAISVDTAKRQARELGHALKVELVILAAHGVAHLLGFDHERGADGAREQAEFELSLLDAVSIAPDLSLSGRGSHSP